MGIVIATILAVAAMTISVLLHYRTMILTRTWLKGSGLARRTGVLVGMAGLTISQMISILIYALIYWGLTDLNGMGSLRGQIEGSFIDPFYFSMMSYTTLGVGDIYPLGAVRVVSGIEALNGFALIGWTASFAYTLMRQGWND